MPLMTHLGYNYSIVLGFVQFSTLGHDGLNGSRCIVKGAHIFSFKGLSQSYAKDKNNVYVHCDIIPKADPKSFYITNGYGRDKNSLYKWATPLPIADIDTFEFFPTGEEYSTLYGKDKYFVYYAGEKIKEADLNTFKILNKEETNNYYNMYLLNSISTKRLIYARDKNSLYISGEKVPFINPETFVDLGSGYLKDRHNVVKKTRKENTVNEKVYKQLEDRDAPTFEMIEYEYTKDKNNVYFRDEIIENADPDSFQVVHGICDNYNCDAKDSNFEYLRGVIISPLLDS